MINKNPIIKYQQEKFSDYIILKHRETLFDSFDKQRRECFDVYRSLQDKNNVWSFMRFQQVEGFKAYSECFRLATMGYENIIILVYRDKKKCRILYQENSVLHSYGIFEL